MQKSVTCSTSRLFIRLRPVQSLLSDSIRRLAVNNSTGLPQTTLKKEYTSSIFIAYLGGTLQQWSAMPWLLHYYWSLSTVRSQWRDPLLT